ncbi:NADPH-dependent F420 reductase [Leekyejoonella antrihumi]|uniref:NADP oxidoreductase n=1 Tax=Leekyejoonella antrihumi TaxID=1660198 RepID=A0A563DUK0_9MICO|nr:NAD(P)-binding domain-containing protein [Leekyejoonella antrihumi]TWP33937.1 NADP oxidoreductase [Leekyejoonella antrihumi]
MSNVSIIGVGNMARAIGARALEGGNSVELIGRDQAKADALARDLGSGATTRAFGSAPSGDIVILAVLYASAVPIVRQYGDALAGKIIVDMANAFAPGATGLLTPDGSSAAEQIADVAPADAHVVKAFNTLFGHVLEAGSNQRRRLDVFLAGDDAPAKQAVSSFIDSLELHPLDAGPLTMARSLEHAGLLMMGLAGNGVGHYNFALAITDLTI